MWRVTFFVYFIAHLVESSGFLIKCCPSGYAFGDNVRCIIRTRGDNETLVRELEVGNETEFTHSCYRSGEVAIDQQDVAVKYDENVTKVEHCTDIDHRNGTVYVRPCPIDWRERIGKCDSIFSNLHFWGASMVLFSNVVYLLPYLTVVIFCLAIPNLRKRTYDKAVFNYNATQLVIDLVLLGIGYFILCHKPIRPAWIYIVLGLSLQFLTISSVIWLNVICLEMTLVITRFRWIPGSDVSGTEGHRKYRIYCAYAWGASFATTLLTGFIELSPWIPINSPIKPNFERFDDGANYAVIIYVSTIPAVTLVLNNVFFIYTTYKVIKIQKSTTVANENNRKVRKKYFMFMRLYLLMDAPSVVGVMAAIYSELWVLKFCRTLQPILMLLAILPKKTFYQAVKCCERRCHLHSTVVTCRDPTTIPGR